MTAGKARPVTTRPMPSAEAIAALGRAEAGTRAELDIVVRVEPRDRWLGVSCESLARADPLTDELDEPTIQKILQDLESLLPLRANPFKLRRYSLASPNAMAMRKPQGRS